MELKGPGSLASPPGSQGMNLLGVWLKGREALGSQVTRGAAATLLATEGLGRRPGLSLLSCKISPGKTSSAPFYR